MRLRDAIRGLVARVTQSYWPSRATRIVYQQRSIAGVRVSPDTALQSATVWACVNILSKSIAQLPWRAMKRVDVHRSAIADNARLDYLLNERPNPEMSAFTFRQTLVGHMLTWGNGFAEIERDVLGRPVNLWPIEPDRVFIKRRPDGTDRLYYQVVNQTKGLSELDFMDMFHVKGLSFDGITGYQTVGYAEQSIGLAMAIERFGAAFFGNGGQPGLVIRNKRANLDKDGVDALVGKFEERHAGPDNAFRVQYLDNDMDVTPISVEPDKGQFIQSRLAQVDEICRWFGVPPHKVARLERSTNNNIEHQGIEFVTDGILPIACQFEQEADFKLIGARNPNRLYTRIDVRSLQRGDLAARTAFYKDMFNCGAFSPNMILEAEGMNPIGEDGDKHFVPVNMQTLEQAGETDPGADDPTRPGAPGDAPAADGAGGESADDTEQDQTDAGGGSDLGAVDPSI